MTDALRFALCGGTFDPIHRGHVEPLMSAYERAAWSRVFFIPAFIQPFKENSESASPYHRFAMAVLATEEDERIEVTPLELERGTVSYTVDSLEAFRERYPGAVFDWVIGDDNLRDLESWRSVERVFQLANFAVLNRAGTTTVPPGLSTRVRAIEDRPRNGTILFLQNPLVPISATDVRTKLRAGEDVSGLLHPRVERYIRRHHLYQSAIELAAERMQTRGS